MCRMFALWSTAPRSVDGLLRQESNCLLRQCAGDHRGEQHHDGWGIGWYDARQPRVLRAPHSAQNDPEFLAAGQSVRASIVLAHVRQASVGSVAAENCHPFICGHWLFMHNGTVERFEHVRPRLEAEMGADWRARRRGTTDSEWLLLWLLARAERAGIDVLNPAVALSALEAIVRQGVRDVARWSAEAPAPTEPDEPTRLNLVLSDGRGLLATRWNYDLGVEMRDDGTTIVSSEPLGAGAWREMPEPSMLTVSPAGRLAWSSLA